MVPLSALALSTSTPLRPSLPTKSLRAVSTCPSFAAHHNGVFFRPPPPDRTAARRESGGVQLRVASVEGLELWQPRHKLEAFLKANARLHVHCLELLQVRERLHCAFERHAPIQIQFAQLAEAAEWLEGPVEACGHGDVQVLQRAVEGGKRLAMASFLERSTCTSCGQERNVTVRKMRQWSRDGPGTYMSCIFLAGVITAWKV